MVNLGQWLQEHGLSVREFAAELEAPLKTVQDWVYRGAVPSPDNMARLSGFIAELLVFVGAFRTQPVLGVLGVIGALLTAVYILRLLAKVFFGPLGERWADQTDASGLERVSTVVLAGFLLLVGLFPFPFMRVIDSGVTELLAHFPGAG